MNLLQKAVYSIRRALSLTDPVGWRDSERTSFSGEPVTTTSVLALSAAWSCVNLLAGTIGSLPVEVTKTVGGVQVPAPEHSLSMLLDESPNADQTSLDFWEFIAASLELQGNAFARIDRRDDGGLIALTPVRPDIVNLRRRDDGTIGYRWSDAGVSYDLTDDDVLHIRGFGGSPLGGLSTLQFGRQAFGIAQAIEKAAGSTFQNGVRASGAFVAERDLTAPQMNTLEGIVTEKYAGAMNAGRPLFLNNGVKWQALTINPEDAQMLESRGFSVEEICRFFGVPPIMIGHGEKTSSWGTGIAEVTQGFVKYTLRRRLKRIEKALQKQLLTAKDRAAGIRIRFNIEGLLRGDSTARSAFYQSALMNGWMTINEVRALENMPPVAGGEVPRMQMQNVPITEKPGITDKPPLAAAA